MECSRRNCKREAIIVTVEKSKMLGVVKSPCCDKHFRFIVHAERTMNKMGVGANIELQHQTELAWSV